MEAPKTPSAKRKANDKWDKENMSTLGCKVKKDEAAAFKEYSAKQGKTANTVLKEYVMECIEGNADEQDKADKPEEAKDGE